MMLGSLIFVVLVVVVVLVVAYAAKFVVDSFFPAPLHVPISLLVGAILLVVLIWTLATHFGVNLGLGHP